MKELVSFDTDRIKSYVFATGKLKEIRGASAILDELNRIDMVKLADDFNADTIYANGGCGMFVVDSEDAQNLIESVQNLYRKSTLTGSISGASIELPDQNDIQPYLRNLAYRLRVCKDSNPQNQSVVSHSYLRPCDSCGQQYAAVDTDEDELLCKSCNNKRQKDEKIKEEIERLIEFDFDEEEPEKLVESGVDFDENKLWHRLIRDLSSEEQIYSLSDRRRPEDFSELGSISTPRNYMGLIYADGNNMGKHIETIQDQKSLSEFSRSVDGAIYESVVSAIKQHLQPYSIEPEVLPFDILLLGGDDLVMVTTADKVIDTAITVTEDFRNFTEAKYEPLTLSIGVAIAHAKFPFGNFLSLAENALKFAKKESAKRKLHQDERDSENGLINFIVVHSSGSLDFNDYYQKELIFKPNNEKFHRTLRPYNVDELKTVQNTIRRLEGFPRNKLHRLREAVFLGQNQSFLEGLTVLSRLKKEEKEELLDFLDYFAEGSGQSFFPWFNKGKEYFTPFLDLVELYNFIE